MTTRHGWIVAGVAFAGVVLLAFVAPVFVSLVIGGGLLWEWRGGRAGLNELSDVLKALRPLTLPLLVLAVVAALGLPGGLQIAIGAVTAAIVVPWLASVVLRPDAMQLGALMGETTVQRRARWLLPVVGFLIALLIWRAVPSFHEFDSRGGFPSALATVSVVTLLLALATRLVGYASSWPRRVVAAFLTLGFFDLLLRVGMFGIRAPGFVTPGTLFVIAAVAFAVGVGAAALRREIYEKSDPPRLLRWLAPDARQPGFLRSQAADLGTALAVTSGVALLLAIGVGYWIVRTGEPRSGDVATSAATRIPDLAGYSDAELALTFLPVLQFNQHAQWSPQTVARYLDTAQLREPDGTEGPIQGPLDTFCPNPSSDPCFTLTHHCKSVDAGCAMTNPREARAEPYHDGAVYVRVTRRATRPPDRSPPPFEEVGPYRKDLSILVQYWFFYPYDEWVAPVLGGQLVQRHEGDWEAVTVGLSSDRPLFVGYSEHCGGTWLDWRSVPLKKPAGAGFAGDVMVTAQADGPLAVRGKGPRDWAAARALNTHPLVAVAVGSQANYPQARAGRAPDWSGCKGIPRSAVGLLSFVWNVRDRTGDDWSWYPAELPLVDARVAPMSFPGTWGEEETTRYVTTDPNVKPLAGGAGPRTPSRQALWRAPVESIFCGRGWHPAHCTRDAQLPGGAAPVVTPG